MNQLIILHIIFVKMKLAIASIQYTNREKKKEEIQYLLGICLRITIGRVT